MDSSVRADQSTDYDQLLRAVIPISHDFQSKYRFTANQVHSTILETTQKGEVERRSQMVTPSRAKLSNIAEQCSPHRRLRPTGHQQSHLLINTSLILVATALLALPAQGQKTTAPGDFWIEPPTLVSLGFEWRITGDDNRNAKVEVTYRKRGDSEWRNGLPLLRLQREQTHEGHPDAVQALKDVTKVTPTAFAYTAPNMFAGSLLNLDPDTNYECRFRLSDPDGVKGQATKLVTVRTRKVPEAAQGGRTFHVYPVDWKGPKEQPAFTGMMEAYYMAGRAGDRQNAFPPRVQPGDVILMHAGTYLSDRHHYFNRPPGPGVLSLGTLFDGTYYLTQRGTPEKPIVIKAAGDGEVVFDGDGAQTLFNVMAADYNYFEGLTIRNANLAFLVGIKRIMGASGFVLKNCKLTNIGRGVQADWSGSKNFYIADNVFIGRHDPDRMMGWNGSFWSKLPGYPEFIGSEYAVKVYGQGHVVAYNYVAHFHDAIDVATYGSPDGTPDQDEIRDRVPVSIDFYNNDMTNMGDNCMEADGGAHNIRIFRNRCANTAAGALGAQPIMGGPAYFYQNIVYNTPTGRAMSFVATSSGLLCYQNTFVGGAMGGGPASNQHFRNNLVLGADANVPVFSVSTYTNYATSDYNGFRPNAGVEESFIWAAPPGEVVADFQNAPAPRRFRTLKEFSDGTHLDQHSIQVDYGMFVNVPMPNNKTDPQRIYDAASLDFRPRPGSPIVDAGIALPNINDNYTGKAPDLGALEADQPVPHYGPRTAISQEARSGQRTND